MRAEPVPSVEGQAIGPLVRRAATIAVDLRDGLHLDVFPTWWLSIYGSHPGFLRVGDGERAHWCDFAEVRQSDEAEWTLLVSEQSGS